MQTPSAAHKRCASCKDFRPLTDFAIRSASPDGRQGYCRPCAADAQRRARPVKQRHRKLPPDQKYCPRCATVQTKAEFACNSSARDGLSQYCRPCHNFVTAENVIKNHGSTRNNHLKRRYGITEADVEALKMKQGGLCAVCRTAQAKHVDHDHATGKVRGILCFNCNGGLGQFKDRIDRLQQAIDYLRDNGTWQKQRVTSGVYRLSSPRPASRPSATSLRWLRLSLRPDGSLQPAD